MLLPFLLSSVFAGDEAPDKDETPEWDIAAPHGPGVDAAFTVTEGTWLSVDVSPDGNSVLFDLLGDLYEIPITGGAGNRLTSGNAWDSDARYSADGTQILFNSDRGGSENIWVAGRDGNDAKPLTEDKHDRWMDPQFAPEPGWFLARKRMTDTRSIGVLELWLLHEQGGKGVQLTSKDDHPHAGEAAFSPDGRSVWFSTRGGRFNYDENIHAGLWQIAKYDRESAEITYLTSLYGGAVRPTPSPDGKSLAFLTRDGVKTALMLIDLQSGKIRRLADDLDKDQMEGFELRGAYPRMDWTPDSRSLVYWADGHLFKIDVGSLVKTRIPFTAKVELRVTDSVHPDRRVERGDVKARVVRWPARAADGTVFAAALGRIWAIAVDGSSKAVTPEKQTAYFPSLSADSKQLAYVSWSDQTGGQVWAGAPGSGTQLTKLAADYQAPAYSPDGKQLVVLRAQMAAASGGDLGAESAFDLVLIPSAGGDGTKLRTIPFRGSNSRSPRPQFSSDGKRIYWIEDEYPDARAHEKTVLRSCDLLGHDPRTHVRFDAAQEVRLSPDGRWLAYKHDHQAWLSPMPALGKVEVDAADLPSRKLTEVVGDWIDFAGPDLTWSHAERFFAAPIAGLLDKTQEKPPTPTERPLSIAVPRASGKGRIALTNARILTMENERVIERGTLVIRDNVIEGVFEGNVPVPGATVLDLGGKTVLPGLIDVHAHLHYASGDVFPEQEWRHLANLAYGVTTVFDPSASTDLVFGQAELIESGRMIGPRTLSTGFILYGADDSQGAKIETYEDAERHLLRLLRVGAWGIKSYQQPRRDQRQWLVEAARKLRMLNVPEGGGDLWNNLGMILDGHSSIEHALNVPTVYSDVRTLWSYSKTTYVPTLLVAYGGPTGEHYFYQHERVWEDPRLTKFVPPDVLRGRGYRLPLYLTDEAEFTHKKTAIDAARFQAAGVTVALGAHGQLQGLGPHWELEALGGQGAMTPMNALRAATIDGAKHLGLDQDIGSIREGKLADLFVVDGDPLVDLRQARNVSYVMKDGLLYDALTMNQLAPIGPIRPPMIWENALRTMGTAQPVQAR